jgi:hypothetical protein
MVLVFVDPFCKHVRLFNVASLAHTNGHYIHFDSNISDFIAEVTLTGLAQVDKGLEFVIQHPKPMVDPAEVLSAFESVTEFCSSYRTQVLNGREKSVLLSLLLSRAEHYKTALDNFATAMETSPFHQQFAGLLDEIRLVNQQQVWRCTVSHEEGAMHLCVKGVGNGKLLRWPSEAKLSTDSHSPTGIIRQMMFNINVLFTQIQWLIKQLATAENWSNKPTRSEFFAGYYHDVEHRYTRRWFYEKSNVIGIRPMVSRPLKRLTVWTELDSPPTGGLKIHQIHRGIP